jgi:protein-arginine kinase activator protein McsA
MANAGEKIRCPHCGHDSVAKVQRVMDGWTVVEERIVCALCQEPLPTDAPPTEDTTDASMSRLNALEDLLGQTSESMKSIDAEDDAHFCKDCIHFLRHPFLSRCLFHDRPTEPMDDCADFAPRPIAESPGDVDE